MSQWVTETSHRLFLNTCMISRSHTCVWKQSTHGSYIPVNSDCVTKGSMMKNMPIMREEYYRLILSLYWDIIMSQYLTHIIQDCQSFIWSIHKFNSFGQKYQNINLFSMIWRCKKYNIIIWYRRGGGGGRSSSHFQSVFDMPDYNIITIFVNKIGNSCF